MDCFVPSCYGSIVLGTVLFSYFIVLVLDANGLLCCAMDTIVLRVVSPEVDSSHVASRLRRINSYPPSPPERRRHYL